jgi:iron-sulfur cluster repair protein YtfE (RIC family)
MLIKLARGVAGTGDPTVVKQLLDCHARIRAFLDIAPKLAAAEGAPEHQVRDVAQRLARYFREALPRHTEDEDCSIAPRLRELEAASEVRENVALMEFEHRELEEVLARLMPRWDLLANEPAALPDHAAELASDSARLRAQFTLHLEREESIVFPALSLLAPDEHTEILNEMRSRRG